jgi:hypothetical protein
VELNDFNCGLKAYKHCRVKNIEVSGEMHRYIPVLAKNAGLEKLVKSSATPARKYGETKFGMERFVNGFGFNYHLVPFSFWKDRCTFWRHGILDVHYRIYACCYMVFQNYTTCIMICATVW